MTRTDTGLVAYSALERDVLSLEISPRSSYPIDPTGAVDVSDLDRVAGHDTLVALTTRDLAIDEDTYMDVADHEVVLDGRTVSPHKVKGDRPLRAIELSEDGRTFVAWGGADWDLRTTAGVGHVKGVSRPLGSDGSIDMDFAIQSVRRFGHSGFLLLDRTGLAHLTAKGKFNRLRDVKCAWDVDTQDRACVAAVGRPNKPGEFLVLRADGTAELWQLQGEGSAKRTGGCTFPDPVYMPDAGEAVLFRPDGRALAVSTENGVQVCRPGVQKPVVIAPDANGVRAYDGEGRLVLSTLETDELWNDDGSGDPVKLYTDEDVMTWVFDGRHLHGETALGPVTYDLGYLTGHATVDTLCRRMPAHHRDIWEDLLDTVDIPPAAHKDPPCPESS